MFRRPFYVEQVTQILNLKYLKYLKKKFSGEKCTLTGPTIKKPFVSF
jgi:hypothetical protein